MNETPVCGHLDPLQSKAAPVLDLGALEALADKVARVHGHSDARLHQVRDLFKTTVLSLEGFQQDLERLRALTDGYNPPANACRSYRGLFSGLKQLDEQGVSYLNCYGLTSKPR